MLTLKAAEQLEYPNESLGYNCSYDFPVLHTHDYWEFLYAKYEFEHVINNKKVIIPANSVVIIKPKDIHMIKGINSNLNPNKEPTHLNAKLTDTLLNQLLSVIDPDLFDQLQKTEDLSRHISMESAQLLEEFLSTLMWSSEKKQNIVMLKTMILYIVNLFYDNIYNVESVRVAIPQEIETIIKKMNSQKYLSCTIAEITKDSNYSYMQLSRLFKKYTGVTMNEYFLNMRLQTAAMNLRLTDKLVLDISNDIGISSLSHFNHIFKSKFGVPPSEYRKK